MYLEIDRNSIVSIKKQLYNGMIELILDGTLEVGERLPSTRALATKLGVARNSVIEIYEQLVAENYAISHVGKGTFINSLDIENIEGGMNTTTGEESISDTDYELNEKEYMDFGSINDESVVSFVPGFPDLSQFPKKIWLDYMKDYLYGPGENKVGYTHIQGHVNLRQSLVQYLRKQKGIKCEEDQIFITSGISGALNIVAMACKDQYSDLWSESPVMDFVPEIFGNHGYYTNFAKVDNNGLNVKNLKELYDRNSRISGETKPCIIYTAPSHHMPLGAVMPIQRRKELVDFAAFHGHLIIEDDYDSEFRYVGAPTNAMKQIDNDNVIYMGTTSKVLGNGIRLGYMVVPKSLVQIIYDYYCHTFQHCQTMDQYCLYRMLDSGHYEKHIYKMTKLYKKKKEYLMDVLKKYIKDKYEVLGADTGLHIALKFANRSFGEEELFQLLDSGLEVDNASVYVFYNQDVTGDPDYQMFESEKYDSTLIIGFGHLSKDQINRGVKILAKYLTDKRY